METFLHLVNDFLCFLFQKLFLDFSMIQKLCSNLDLSNQTYNFTEIPIAAFTSLLPLVRLEDTLKAKLFDENIMFFDCVSYHILKLITSGFITFFCTLSLTNSTKLKFSRLTHHYFEPPLYIGDRLANLHFSGFDIEFEQLSVPKQQSYYLMAG
ncbi:hypothetical protein BpHYR1_001993 [Brachionus plicatilis]|uniref:Uncharacterized protein n=1 Tax=Brachionus plicatilis TaxID=10195 RepID=A0A3M7R054_BRAPC|nr:hypothetical protein BpHYR1_001993 [Brachionus plicatilis]